MSNAAIFFASDAFDTGRRLMGRQSAGESFLRGFIRHAEVDRFYFWNWADEPLDKAQALIRRIEPTEKPSTWYGRSEFAKLAEPGCLFISAPAGPREAWNRRLFGPARYSLCGLTHTTASEVIMNAVVDHILAPIEPWDALICTSQAVRKSLDTQLGLAFSYLRERLGATKAPPVRLEVIPLGINTEDFAHSPTHRAKWRTRLGIGEDDIAVLYVGRFSPQAKMNSIPMAIALERAAKATGRTLHWVLVGHATSEHLHRAFVETPKPYAPSVKFHVLDGREPDVRFAIWSVGDVFLSLSDNIQETFGLTPVEAMAAGLPSVISDWDGYRDTVRHGIDGFRIPTAAPAPGMGLDLAINHANGWVNYDRYVGAAAQLVAVDLKAAADALTKLIENADLRRSMGEAARRRAVTDFDWKAIIPRYQALWSELDAIRLKAAGKASGPWDPWRPDPFSLFASYPTRALSGDVVARAEPGLSFEAIIEIAKDPLVGIAGSYLPRSEEIRALVDAILDGPKPLDELWALFPAARRNVIARCVLWFAKYGLVGLSPEPTLSTG